MSRDGAIQPRTKQKAGPWKLAGFHNHFPLLTMVKQICQNDKRTHLQKCLLIRYAICNVVIGVAVAIALVPHVWPCVVMLCTVPPLWLRFTFFNVLLFSVLGMAGVSPVVDDMQGTSIESCNGKIGSSCSGPRASSASAESDSGISSSVNSAFLSLLTGRDGLIVGDGNQLTLQHNSMERDKRTVGRGECDPDCSSKAGNQPPPEHNPSEPDQLTEGSREPDAANSSYRNWERQGARPKHTQMQGPVGLPVWPSSRLVSNSVAEDLLPHHSQDKVVRESPERFRDTSFVHGSDSPYFGTVLPPDYFVTNDHSLTGEEDSSREWDSLLDQNFCGSLLPLQQINTPISPNSWFVNGSTCSDYDAGIHPGYSMYRAQRNAVEANDNSPVASEQGTAEPEQIMSELQEKKQLIRDKGERTRPEQEDSKWQGAEPSQQEDVSTGSRRLCEHYERRCRVRFSCCTEFYPCHNCHNNSTNCQNGEAKARDATHLKCSLCQFEQEVSFWFSLLRVQVTVIGSLRNTLLTAKFYFEMTFYHMTRVAPRALSLQRY